MIHLLQNDLPKEFSSWVFPGKEIGVKIPDIDPAAFYHIVCELITSEEVFVILNLADALAKAGVPKDHVILYMPYFPYARQDRVCNQGESFALEVFVKVLSTGHFQYVISDDVHSQVCHNLMEKAPMSFFENDQGTCAEDLPKFDFLVAPDAGASTKILKHVQMDKGDTKVVILSKTREDGQVVYDDLPVGTLTGRICVVDDLCDGGATFISLGKMLLGTQPEITELCLYVTHGIFSKGVDIVKEVYSTIYVHNMYNGADLEKVVII